jgi:hypothetical protein
MHRDAEYPRPAVSVPVLLVLVLSLIGAQEPGGAAPPAVASVPPEPGVVMLPARPTLQAIAGDVDGDGARELVRLVQDGAGASVVEAWRQEGDRWVSAGEAVALRAPIRRNPDADDVYGDGASRLIAWHDGARERVLVATQPRFELLDLDVGERCCLLLDELVPDAQGPDGIALRSLAARSPSVDGLLAIDVDGDGVDELLATRSHARSGGAVPLTVLLYRWQGTTFGVPETRDLLYGGDGSAPFRLGDTDGVPGDEAGLLADGTAFHLYRIRLDADGRLAVEPSGIGGVAAAAAVRLPGGSGVALQAAAGLLVHRWAPGEDPVEIAARPAAPFERLVGVLDDGAGASVLVVTQPLAGDPPLMLTADTFEARRPSVPPRRIPQAIDLAARYAGPIPGGDAEARTAVISNGTLYPAGVPVASFVNAAPLGFVGDGSWLALIHADVAPDAPSPSGGALEDAAPLPGGRLSIAPSEVALAAEEDAGRLTAPMEGTVADPTGRSSVPFVDAAGFRTSVEAPPGSRIVVGGAAPARFAGPLVVPESGVLPVRIRPSEEVRESGLIEPWLVVLTPSGHAYVARWELRVLGAPPPLDASAQTSLGAIEVTVRGRTLPYAEVRVDGRSVATDADGRFAARAPAPPWPTTMTVEATDPLGNQSRVEVEAVGLIDYRRLPWPAIVGILTLAVAVGLWLRVPRIRGGSRRDGDARLEDLEP